MYVQLFCLEGTSANLITSLCLLELELWYRVLSLYAHSGKHFFVLHLSVCVLAWKYSGYS